MDPQELILSWAPTLTPGLLLTGVVWMVLTGRLVPGREMRYWREAFFEEQRQKQQLLAAGRVAQDVLRAIPEALGEAEG